MSIRNVYRKEVATISPKASVLAAAQLMKQSHLGSLIVVEQVDGVGRPVGILTDRDIVRLVVANQGNAAEMQVEDVMTRDVKSIREDEDEAEAMKKMRLLGVRRMPVVGRDGGLLGMVSLDDFLGLIAAEMGELARVSARQRKEEERRTLLT